MEHVCNGCLASVWVVRETGALVDAKVVEHEERGEVTKGWCSNGPSDDCTSTLFGFDGEDTLHDGSGDVRHFWWW